MPPNRRPGREVAFAEPGHGRHPKFPASDFPSITRNTARPQARMTARQRRRRYRYRELSLYRLEQAQAIVLLGRALGPVPLAAFLDRLIGPGANPAVEIERFTFAARKFAAFVLANPRGRA